MTRLFGGREPQEPRDPLSHAPVGLLPSSSPAFPTLHSVSSGLQVPWLNRLQRLRSSLGLLSWQRSSSDPGEDDLFIQRCDTDVFLTSLINCGGRCGGSADDVRGGLIASHYTP